MKVRRKGTICSYYSRKLEFPLLHLCSCCSLCLDCPFSYGLVSTPPGHCKALLQRAFLDTPTPLTKLKDWKLHLLPDYTPSQTVLLTGTDPVRVTVRGQSHPQPEEMEALLDPRTELNWTGLTLSRNPSPRASAAKGQGEA